MKLRTLAKALLIKAKQKRENYRGIAKSYVSLFLVVILLVGSATAWFVSREGANISSDILKMTGTSEIRDDSSSKAVDEVIIPEFRLEEASSVDGRNLYFPASFSNNVSDVSSGIDTITDLQLKTVTEGMVYREANAGDKNVRYAYADKTITSSGGKTDVWIKGYKIEIGDNVYEDNIDIVYENGKPVNQKFPDSCPVRIAIISDSAETPKVIDPSALVKSYAENTDAVYYITQEGKPTTQKTNLDAFSSFYYGTENPLFTIEAGKSLNFTIVAWLEGTHKNARAFEGKKMSVEVEIETNVSEMEMIYLHDNTVGDEYDNITKDNYKEAADWKGGNGQPSGHWLSNNVVIAMSYYDTVDKTYKTTVMSKVKGENYLYQAAIPMHVKTDISFYRLSTTDDKDVDKGTVYNSWHTYSNVYDQMTDKAKDWSDKLFGKPSSTRGNYVHYYAIRGNGHGLVDHNASDRHAKWLSPCVGYWGTESGPVQTSN